MKKYKSIGKLLAVSFLTAASNFPIDLYFFIVLQIKI